MFAIATDDVGGQYYFQTLAMLPANELGIVKFSKLALNHHPYFDLCDLTYCVESQLTHIAQLNCFTVAVKLDTIYSMPITMIETLRLI